MAYNVFKRPMFKRGGSTTGTGIMSHVEPRTKAAEGFLGDLFKPARNPDGTMVQLPQRSFADDASFLIGPGKFLKAGGKGLDILKQAGKYATKPDFYAGPTGITTQLSPAKFLSTRYLKEAARPYLSGASETLKAAGKGIKDFGKEYGLALGIGAPVAGTAAYNLLKDDEEGISDEFAKARQAMTSDEAYKGIAEDLDISEPSKKETDEKPQVTFEDTYQTEKKRIEKLLGDDDSKGMAAIALSEAIGTPGTIADKAAVLNKSLLKIMAGKKKDKRDIAKLAYTATKEIEKAKIMANKEGYTEKLAKEARGYETTLRDPNASEADKNYARNQLDILKSSIAAISPKTRDGLTSIDKDFILRLNEAGKKLKRAAAKDKTSDAYKKALDDYRIVRLAASKNPQLLDLIALSDAQVQAFKDGGRVNRAMGTPEMGETPTTPVQKLSFAELRNRLPKEITDDIITLLSNSEEALQDFAYIKTQGDVNKFNIKYGVNAVLPAQA